MQTKKQLLLVDDDANDVALFLQAMSRLQLQDVVATAQDGIEALNYLQPLADPELPRVLVIDYKMPRLDGVGLLHALRDDPRLRVLPVILLSTSNHRLDIARAYAAGANGYLLKPISFDDFCRDVALLVDFWLRRNISPLQPLPNESL